MGPVAESMDQIIYVGIGIFILILLLSLSYQGFATNVQQLELQAGRTTLVTNSANAINIANS